MTTLVQAASTVRKGARAWFGYITIGLLGLLDLLGAFTRREAIGFEHGLVALAWLCVCATRVFRMRGEQRDVQDGFLDLELGCLLLTAAYATLQLCGGLLSPFYPALYVLIAFMTSFAERKQGRLIVLFAVAFEAPLYFFTEGQRDPKPYALHAIFLTLFGLINTLFTQAELARVRLLTHRERAEEKRRVQREVRLFRLTPTSYTNKVREEDLWRSSVAEVRCAVDWNLSLLKSTLDLHSAVLLLREHDVDALRIVAFASDSVEILPGPFASGEGAIGACYRRGVIMNLEHLRPGYPGIWYYGQRDPVRAFIAVPVREQDAVIGVLCADRLEDRGFTPAEEEILIDAVEHLLHALENERVFVQLERNKREQAVLYEASQALGSARSEQAVLDAALHAAAQIVSHDFAAFTHYDSQARQHALRHVVGDGAERLADLRFRDNASLVAMAVQNRHYLPYRGDFDAQNQTVFTRDDDLRHMQSLLILPLCVRDVAIGTLVLAAKRRDAFPLAARPALQLLANQVAVALGIAESVARLEELATTDGLTGCYNKRYFLEELKQRLHVAQRFQRKVSLIIADIDHFKAVNDTHGHHVGDVVIRELGAILKRLKRETDVVARFGGEEFCVLCEETSSVGALQLAERVRQELLQAQFDTQRGVLSVSCSLGVATYPDHASDKDALFAAADRALYAAKHAGRNQVRTA